MCHTTNIEEQLKTLCIEVLKRLKELLNQGLITPEEYRLHTSLKEQFLQSIEQKNNSVH